MNESSVADIGVYQLKAHEQRIPKWGRNEEVGKFELIVHNATKDLILWHNCSTLQSFSAGSFIMKAFVNYEKQVSSIIKISKCYKSDQTRFVK